MKSKVKLHDIITVNKCKGEVVTISVKEGVVLRDSNGDRYTFSFKEVEDAVFSTEVK